MDKSELVSSNQRNDDAQRRAKILLLASSSVIIFASDLWVAGQIETSKADHFFQFWAAGKAILQGSDPYQPRAWRQI